MRRLEFNNYCRIKNSNRTSSFGKICVFFSILFLSGCVFLAIQVTLVFSRIAFLESEESKLMQEKFSLQEKLLKTDSLNRAMLFSAQKGFVENIKMIYLFNEEPVAKLP